MCVALSSNDNRHIILPVFFLNPLSLYSRANTHATFPLSLVQHFVYDIFPLPNFVSHYNVNGQFADIFNNRSVCTVMLGR